MNKKLEKIGILCNSMEECKMAIAFLVDNGVFNKHGMTGNIVDCNIDNNRVYYVLNDILLCGVQSKYANTEPSLREDVTIKTIPQIKKMLCGTPTTFNSIVLGTPIMVQNIGMQEWHKRIYICSSEFGAVCVDSLDEEKFKKGFSFHTILWDKFRPIQ